MNSMWEGVWRGRDAFWAGNSDAQMRVKCHYFYSWSGCEMAKQSQKGKDAMKGWQNTPHREASCREMSITWCHVMADAIAWHDENEASNLAGCGAPGRNLGKFAASILPPRSVVRICAAWTWSRRWRGEILVNVKSVLGVDLGRPVLL